MFINACVRECSRTLALSKSVLDKLGGVYTEVNLEREKIKPLNRERLEERERLIGQDDFSGDVFKTAKEFSEADTIN